MKTKDKKQVDWAAIDTVLLDMDGTLIDRHHEDYFWETLIPGAYARKNRIAVAEARKKLFRLYAEMDGTPEWSDIHWWEKKLGLDLWSLRPRIRPLMKLHPHTVRFLRFLRRHGKKVYLVSASDREDVDFKLVYKRLKEYFDGIYCHDDIGKSKHDQLFWKNLQKRIKFDKDRTLFADDKEDILRAAREFGIRYLVFKAKSSSRLPAFQAKDFISVRHFDDIL